MIIEHIGASVWNNIEFSAGVGQGLYAEVELLDAIGLEMGIYGNYATFRLEDGEAKFGQEVNMGATASLLGYNLGSSNYIFKQYNEVLIDEERNGFYADETLTLISIAVYPLAGFSLNLGFDIVQFCKDLDEG